MGESFNVLQQLEIITPNIAEKMKKSVGLDGVIGSTNNPMADICCATKTVR
jgi:hypothetical protein